MLRNLHFRALLVGAFAFTTACSDMPTAPEPEVAPQAGLLGDVLGIVTGTVGGVVETVVGILSPVLTRENPLSRDEVVTQTVGRWGGTLVLPRAGLTVTIPPGALDRNTRITVRAPRGELMGYEFGPHGLEFNRPVILTQQVSRRAASEGLEVVYFDGALQPTVGVLEVLPVATFRDRAVFAIEHFSGYAFRKRGYVVATD